MLNHLKLLPALALLALATSLVAQEATDTPSEEPDSTEPADPGTAPATETSGADTGTETAPAQGATAADAPSDLSMGEPATGTSDEPRPGQPYIREQFGDWALRCLRAEEGPDPCQLYQLLKDADGNAVAEISMFPLPPGGEAVAGATIVAPLETLLTEDLTISVDGSTPRRYPFSFCNRAGCVARVGFTQEEVEQFKRGNDATLSVVPAAAPDRTVTLSISLTGFTAGFEASAVPPPAEDAPAE